jgi:hypothetical protein
MTPFSSQKRVSITFPADGSVRHFFGFGDVEHTPRNKARKECLLKEIIPHGTSTALFEQQLRY